MELKSSDFRERRKSAWKDLERLLEKVNQRGVRSLEPSEIMRLAKLYRTACSSLYMTRNISLDRNLNEYLERLVLEGYLGVYCSKPPENLLKRFFLHDYPNSVRKYFWYHFVAFIFMIAGFFIGYWSTQHDPVYYFTFVDRGLASGRTPYSPKEKLEEVLVSGRDQSTEELTFFASSLFTHNTKVGFLCFTLGVVVGIPSLYLCLYNGSMLGAMTQIYHKHGLSEGWWAWILAHGVTELLAIILCSGAGLMIGIAIVSPSKYGRWHKLKTVGREAGITVLGTVMLFFIAGVIEGIFRQSSAPNEVRYLVAMVTFVFWIFYFGFMRIPSYEKQEL